MIFESVEESDMNAIEERIIADRVAGCLTSLYGDNFVFVFPLEQLVICCEHYPERLETIRYLARFSRSMENACKEIQAWMDVRAASRAINAAMKLEVVHTVGMEDDTSI
jgi:hypothetical protein